MGLYQNSSPNYNQNVPGTLSWVRAMTVALVKLRFQWISDTLRQAGYLYKVRRPVIITSLRV